MAHIAQYAKLSRAVEDARESHCRREQITPAAPPANAYPPPTPQAPTPLHKRLHAGKRGRVRVVLRCPDQTGVCSKGTITLFAEIPVLAHHGRRHRKRSVSIELARTRFGAHDRGEFTVWLRLNRRGKMLLRDHRYRLNISVTIVSPGRQGKRVRAVLR